MSVIWYGPVPTGFASNALASADAAAWGTILTTANRSLISENGYFSAIVTVLSSFLDTVSMKGMKVA